MSATEAAALTTTMKVRRNFLLAKYRDRLDALYASGHGRGDIDATP